MTPEQRPYRPKIFKMFFPAPLFAVFLAFVCVSDGFAQPRPYVSRRMRQGMNPWTGNYNAVFGVKFLDAGVWSPVNLHRDFGLQIDVRRQSWPISLLMEITNSQTARARATGALPSLGNSEFAGVSRERNLGLRRNFREDAALRYSVDAGLGHVSADLSGVNPDGKSERSTDQGIGAFLGAGVYFSIANTLNMGFHGRYTYHKVKLLEKVGNGSGLHLWGLVGYHF